MQESCKYCIYFQFSHQKRQFFFRSNNAWKNWKTFKEDYQGVRFLRNTKKASQDASIPARVIKENSDLFAHFILKDYNDRLIKREFPQTLNIVNVTPVQKKD